MMTAGDDLEDGASAAAVDNVVLHGEDIFEPPADIGDEFS
jgi:hypothetical protein